MGYTEKTLTVGEAIKYRGKIHWIVYIWPIIWLIVAIVCFASGEDVAPAGGFFILLAIIMGLRSFILTATSEFVITTKRVVMKTGFIRRNSTDVLLSKMEAFNVDQGILGRILNYGTLVVGGTGGSKGGFKHVSDPLEFRKRVQVELESVK